MNSKEPEVNKEIKTEVKSEIKSENPFALWGKTSGVKQIFPSKSVYHWKTEGVFSFSDPSQSGSNCREFDAQSQSQTRFNWQNRSVGQSCGAQNETAVTAKDKFKGIAKNESVNDIYNNWKKSLKQIKRNNYKNDKKRNSVNNSNPNQNYNQRNGSKRQKFKNKKRPTINTKDITNGEYERNDVILNSILKSSETSDNQTFNASTQTFNCMDILGTSSTEGVNDRNSCQNNGQTFIGKSFHAICAQKLSDCRVLSQRFEEYGLTDEQLMASLKCAILNQSNGDVEMAVQNTIFESTIDNVFTSSTSSSSVESISSMVDDDIVEIAYIPAPISKRSHKK